MIGKYEEEGGVPLLGLLNIFSYHRFHPTRRLRASLSNNGLR